MLQQFSPFSANGSELDRNKFKINSQRTQLTLPNVAMSDSMCFQCIIENDYGSILSDGCMIVIGALITADMVNSWIINMLGH